MMCMWICAETCRWGYLQRQLVVQVRLWVVFEGVVKFVAPVTTELRGKQVTSHKFQVTSCTSQIWSFKLQVISCKLLVQVTSNNHAKVQKNELTRRRKIWSGAAACALEYCSRIQWTESTSSLAAPAPRTCILTLSQYSRRIEKPTKIKAKQTHQKFIKALQIPCCRCWGWQTTCTRRRNLRTATPTYT